MIKDASLNDRVELRVLGEVGAKIWVMDLDSPGVQWSMAQLGWIAGPAAMLLFAAITLLSAFLPCDCYRSPHYLFGPSRNWSYLDAVLLFLGTPIVSVFLLCSCFPAYGKKGPGSIHTGKEFIAAGPGERAAVPWWRLPFYLDREQKITVLLFTPRLKKRRASITAGHLVPSSVHFRTKLPEGTANLSAT
ncbi:Probable amino acid permease 7 [Linum perenne]